MKGDSILRIVAQSTPAKKGCCLISSAEFRPNLVSCPTIILSKSPSVDKTPLDLHEHDSLSDEILRLATQSYILREVQLILPIDNLAVRIVRILRAERRVADQTFEHDRSE